MPISPFSDYIEVLVRRAVLTLAVMLAVWGVMLLLTGGIVFDTPWGSLSSRAAVRPLILSGLVLIVYLTRWRSYWSTDTRVARNVRLARALGIGAIVVTAVIGVRSGTRVAGGPDASAYVSLSAVFVRGALTLPAAAWVRDAPWENAPLLAAPVGYTPGRLRDRLAPVVSPGLPLLMAVAQVIGGTAAVFYVVPVLGGVAVWATWRLGATIGGAWAGAAAAWLVALSPAFVAMLVQPMSDVPTATFWALALLAAWRGRAVGSGLATAMAILIRPNVAPLAIAPVALMLIDRRPGVWTRVAVFAAMVMPACTAIGGLNAYYHGSPLQSGYGLLDGLYDTSRIGVNLGRYGSWFLASETAVPLLGVLAPLSVARGPQRWRLLVVASFFPVAVVLMYVPYLVFPSEEWQYLRFLLPAYPALMIGVAVLAGAIARRRSVVSTTLAIAIVLIVIAHGARFARASGVYGTREADLRYVRVAAYVRRLPPTSIVVSRLHSGTVHFYTDRNVLRFDALAPSQLDAVIFHLQDRGYGVYVVSDDSEIDLFRTLAKGTRTGALLDDALGIDVGGSAIYRLIGVRIH
jgi:hypothetical protein